MTRIKDCSRKCKVKMTESPRSVCVEQFVSFSNLFLIPLFFSTLPPDDVLSFVYEGMFPAKAPAGLGSTDTLPSMSGNGSHRNLGLSHHFRRASWNIQS